MPKKKVMQRFIDETNTIYWEEIEIEVDDPKREVPFEEYKQQDPKKELKKLGKRNK